MDNSRNVQLSFASSVAGRTPAQLVVGLTETERNYTLETRWLLWLDAAELLAGRDLHDTENFNAAWAAFKAGKTAGDFVLSLSSEVYPPQYSQALLRLTICVLYVAALVGGLLACFPGGGN